VADSEPTPLVAKLGIVEGSSLVVLAAPGDVTLDLPAGVHLRRQARGTADVVLAFFTEVAALEVRIERVAPMVFPAGALWIAWPKRASGVATDMTDGDVRSVALPLGLVDNLCHRRHLDRPPTGLAPGPPARNRPDESHVVLPGDLHRRFPSRTRAHLPIQEAWVLDGLGGMTPA
jgi:hypothetical protein